MKVDSDTILELVNKLRSYIQRKISDQELNYWVCEHMNATEEDIEAGEQSHLLNHIFWSVRHLIDPEQFRTKDEEIEYLLDCLEGRKQFTKEEVGSIYRKKNQ